MNNCAFDKFRFILPITNHRWFINLEIVQRPYRLGK